MGGEYRAIDSFITNYGFRLQYNKMFKAEYLPARVKYNAFFFFTAVGVWYGMNKNKVS